MIIVQSYFIFYTLFDLAKVPVYKSFFYFSRIFELHSELLMHQPTKPSKKQPEAAESSAGDDFHVLWTAKRSFDLLNFDEDGLKAIAVEGIDPKYADKLDSKGENFLGVDLAEYFGGYDFQKAQKVVISQLKYSTRQTDKNWTFFQLYEGKKSGSTDGSIIHRLAQAYKTLLKEFGRDDVLKKLTLKLTSNRKFNPDQKQVIDAIQAFLKPKQAQVYIGTVTKTLPKKGKEAIEKLYKATKLGSGEFTDFLRLLSFEDCGIGSRIEQEIAAIQAMKSVGVAHQAQSHTIFWKVWRKMLPNAESNQIIMLDFLYWLDTSLEGLFPVSHKFEQPDHWVERQQVGSIMDTIAQSTGKPICLHGAAGIGKSVTAQLIQKNIPKGSEIILFDCYGRGDYSNPSDGRHLHQEAIVQICNELAKRLGTSFLIPQRGEANHVYVRELKHRIELAVKMLRKKTPDATLVLLIDAADNSITAAQDKKSISFVQDLLQEPFDEGFRLVVTTRTHRVASLDLPHDHINIPLEAFTEAETQQHLQFYYPESTPEEAQEFHELTYGVPRVQMYTLELKQEGIHEVINYLKPAGKNIEDIFQEAIQSAAKRLGKNGIATINTFFERLVALPTPVPLSYLQVIYGFSNDELKDFAHDIWHGLILDESSQTLSFRDEDFETYVREKYKPNQAMYEKVADLFLQKANEDEYASVHLGAVLFRAGRKDQLAEIVINETYNKLPVDSVRQKEVYIERTQLAMKTGSLEDNPLTFLKLMFIAADTAKTNTALQELLTANADLAVVFKQNNSLERLYTESEKQPWAGNFNFQLAAAYAKQESTKGIAKRHLEAAKKWVQWVIKNRKHDKSDKFGEEDRNYYITSEDVALGGEAHLHIDGAKEAARWLSSCKPKKFLFATTDVFFDNVLQYATEEQIRQWLDSLNFKLSSKLLIIHKLKHFKSAPFGLGDVLIFVRRLLKQHSKLEFDFQELIISFCEVYARVLPEEKAVILQILDGVQIELPKHLPTFSEYAWAGGNDRLVMEVYLRKHTLQASLSQQPLELQDIYPASLKGVDVDDKESFDRFYKHALPIYQLRIDAMLAQADEQECITRFETICQAVKNDREIRYYRRYESTHKLIFLASRLSEVLPFLGQNTSDFVDAIITSFDQEEQKGIDLRVSVVEKIAFMSALKKATYILLNETTELISNTATHASKIVNYYIQLTRIAWRLDRHVSEQYFEKAVEAVNEIDTEAWEKIACIYELTRLGIPQSNPHLAFEFTSFVEYCKSRLRAYDEKYLRIENCIKGIANLDPATAFASICKWDHRDVTSITEQVIHVMQVALNKNFVTPIIGSTLLPLYNFYWKDYAVYVQDLIQQYDQQGNRQQKTLFIKHLLRDLQIHCELDQAYGIVPDIFKALQGSKLLNKEVFIAFREYHDFIVQTYKAKEGKKDKSYNHTSRVLPPPTYDLTHVNITSPLSLNEALQKIKNENERKHTARKQTSDFLEQVQAACSPENYAAHLDAFISIDPKLLDIYDFERALKARLEEWDFMPTVNEWKKKNFEKTYRLWYTHFFNEDALGFSHIQEMQEIFEVDDFELSRVVAKVLPEKIDKLSASLLYQFVELIQINLDQDQNEYLLNWVLGRWNKNIREKFIDEKYDISSQSSDWVIAQTLRYILGNPYKSIRWKGLHALRRMTETGNTDVLQILLEQQNNRDCSPFQHQEYQFFWISAKLYLWICLAKIAKETPEIATQFTSHILQEVHNDDVPHALIQYFVKQTCLYLHQYDPTVFSVAELENIQGLLVSKQTAIQENYYDVIAKNSSLSTDDFQFNFDELDTTRYWYEPLGRRFGLSRDEVTQLADQCIREIFGYTGNVRKDNHVNISDNNYHLTSSRHGNLPAVENLQRYYEYHAMFCVAAQLINRYPLLAKDPNDYDSWENWLKDSALSFDEYWLSDLRTPLPPNAKFWAKSNTQFDQNWLKNVTEEKYDEEIGFSDTNKVTELNLYGHHTTYFGKNYETVSINSAIVTQKTSTALLRALQTAEDHYDYRVPLEGEDLVLDYEGFQMIGWLKEEHSDCKGLEENDYLAKDIKRGFFMFGKEVTQFFDIQYDKEFKTAYHQESLIATYQNWDNTTDYKGYSDIQSSGYLFAVNAKFLLEFLKRRKMHLIAECVVTRSLDSDKHGYGEHKRENKAKLYLIKANGEVTTLRGRNYKIG